MDYKKKYLKYKLKYLTVKKLYGGDASLLERVQAIESRYWDEVLTLDDDDVNNGIHRLAYYMDVEIEDMDNIHDLMNAIEIIYWSDSRNDEG